MRRVRKAREAIKPNPEPEGPIPLEQAAARFRSLRCPGGFRFGFVAYGPVVKATTPAELEAATAIELARMLKDEPEN